MHEIDLFSNFIYLSHKTNLKKQFPLALAGMAQLVGAPSLNRKVAGLIPSQGTYPGCGFVPQFRGIQEATNQCFSLSLLLFLKATKNKFP